MHTIRDPTLRYIKTTPLVAGWISIVRADLKHVGTLFQTMLDIGTIKTSAFSLYD